MLFNKKIITALLLISIFAVGTIALSDTVNAATWKKYDSETYSIKKPDPGFKKKATIDAYIKGSKDIKVNFYGYKIKNNKKTYYGTLYASKTGNTLKLYSIDKKGKKSKTGSSAYPGTIKQFYKDLKTQLKKG